MLLALPLLCWRQTSPFYGGKERRGISPEMACRAWIPVASVLVLSVTPVTSKQETAVWETVAARRNGNLFPKRALSLSVLRVGLVILPAWKGNQSQISILSGSVHTYYIIHVLLPLAKLAVILSGNIWTPSAKESVRLFEGSEKERDWTDCLFGAGFTLAPLCKIL